MIELVLQAERALTVGLVDQAEALYQTAIRNDPRNSIAMVGLARVALERGDDPGALEQARRALAIDPENAAALRLESRLSEVLGAGAANPTVTVPAPPPAPPSTVSQPPSRGRRGLLGRIIGR